MKKKTNKLKVLDLFSGIGGFSLGLERTGEFETIGFCEIDSYCQKVLKKHWPNIPIFEDVNKLKGKLIKDSIDVICGGFPCQDISVANTTGEGLEGKRSGLWKEYHRLIKEIKPRYAIIENVANLRSKGLNQVLKDLWKVGYDCEWFILSAAAVGAPHLRERVWIIAYPNSNEIRLKPRRRVGQDGESKAKPRNSNKATGDSSSEGFQGFFQSYTDAIETIYKKGFAQRSFDYFNRIQAPNIPESVRMDDGLPYRVDRAKALGNAVVPQIPQLIGQAIIDYEKSL